jgi:16S rRNA (guanine527-N7)-methyltransferase
VSDGAELTKRLVALADRWSLPSGSVGQLERLLLAIEADERAPTTVRDPPEAIDVHVADSLAGLQVSGFRERSSVVDIGSGAGFPGLVLAVAMPAARFDLLEASSRSCAFLERAVATLALHNAQVVRGRAEEWAAREGAGAYQGAVVRAVASLATLAEYSAPLLAVGGVLVAWKGRRNADEERGGAAAAARLGLRALAVEPATPFDRARHRHLYVYDKVAETPAAFPRRPGMARKRPLGGRPRPR